jgi:Helix-turn-helix.
MIKNEKQLKQSEKQLQMLKTIADKYEKSSSLSERAQFGALECQIEDLENEIEEYSKVVESGIDGLEFNASNIEKVIMSLRIASGFTQKELSNKLGVAEQQIQRYEEQNYQKASFERIIQIMRAMSDDFNLIFRRKTNIIPFGNLKIKEEQNDKIKEIQRRGSLLSFGS